MGRRGSTAVLVLLVLFVAIGLGAYAFLSGRAANEPETPVEERVLPAEAAGEAGASEAASGTLAEVDERDPRAIGSIEVRPTGEYASRPRSFDGTGTIRGEVRVEGVPYPESWTLRIEPSLFGESRDRAEARVIVGESGMRTFEAQYLPMASYRLVAEAPGMASRPSEVILCRLEGGGALDELNVDLVLRPFAYVTGSVRVVNGDVADDLPIALVERRNRGGDGDVARLETRSNSVGQFQLDAVPPGAWLVYVGGESEAVVPPIPVEVGLEPVKMDEVTLPPLAPLEITALDEFGRPFPGVEVSGYLRGEGKGSFRTVSDAVGVVRVRFLTPGTWRIEGTYEAQGVSGRIDVPLGLTPSAIPVELYVR